MEDQEKLKYRIGTEENREFLKEQRDVMLKFGQGFVSPEGGAYYLASDGSPMKDRPRETWITCRMAHVYSLGLMLGNEYCAGPARAAMGGLKGELMDRENGGWYPGIDPKGGILPDKQCYAHAFVILAASSAMLAGIEKNSGFIEEALAVFDRYFWDEEYSLTKDTWDTGFRTLSDYRGLNANMHTAEAFLAASDVLGDEVYRERAGKIIGRVIAWARDNSWRIPEHYDKNWRPQPDYNKEKPEDPFKPYGATPGHGIEWARLIVQWAKSSAGDDSGKLKEYVDAAEKLYCRAMDDAWGADGEPGLCYTTDWNGRPVVHDRMHWTLAEAVNTSAVLYNATGKDRYADDYGMLMKYIDAAVIDHEKGSWFHQLDRYGQVLDTVWPGKPDLYHAVQATLIPYNPNVGDSVGLYVSKF